MGIAAVNLVRSLGRGGWHDWAWMDGLAVDASMWLGGWGVGGGLANGGCNREATCVAMGV